MLSFWFISQIFPTRVEWADISQSRHFTRVEWADISSCIFSLVCTLYFVFMLQKGKMCEQNGLNTSRNFPDEVPNRQDVAPARHQSTAIARAGSIYAESGLVQCCPTLCRLGVRRSAWQILASCCLIRCSQHEPQLHPVRAAPAQPVHRLPVPRTEGVHFAQNGMHTCKMTAWAFPWIQNKAP